MAYRLGAALARERPNLLQFATLEDGYLAWWTRRALGLKHILYAHGNEILVASRSPWRKPMEALLSSERVVANSRFTARLLTEVGVDDERIRIIHPGCDTDVFVPRSVPESARLRLAQGRRADHYLLTVGGLVPRKGHDTVIRAVARLRGIHDVVYLIAGDGPQKQELLTLANHCGIADRVVFLGLAPSSDLPLLYSMADVFVMVSREIREDCSVEGFGIVFIEAGSSGTAVVAGRSGGVEDAVVDGQTGLLVNPHSVEDVASAISTLLSDRALAQRLGDEGRRRAASAFSWAHFGTNVSSVLEEALRE